MSVAVGLPPQPRHSHGTTQYFPTVYLVTLVFQACKVGARSCARENATSSRTWHSRRFGPT
jgi:hypothetical protein